MHKFLVRTSLAAALLLSFTSHGLAWQEQQVVAQKYPTILNEILVDRWTRNRENRNFDQEFEVNPANRTGNLIALAFTVNRVHHYKYDRASQVANRLVVQDPALLDAWYCKTWLDLRDGQVDSGLVGLQEYRKNLDAADLPAADRHVHLSRMGRLLGYADGPGNARATPDTLSQTLDAVSQNLADDELKLFESQYHKVLDRFTELVNARTEHADQALVKAQEDQKQELENLKQELKNLGNVESNIVDQADKVQQRTEKDISTLNQQMAPLESNLSAINADIYTVERDIIYLHNSLARARERAIDEPDPVLRDLYWNDVARLSLAINRRQADLFQLRREYDLVADQLDRLVFRVQQLQSAANVQLDQLGDELRSVDRQRKKNAGKTRRASKAPRARNATINSLENRTRFLGTYDPFPADSLKQAILNRF